MFPWKQCSHIQDTVKNRQRYQCMGIHSLPSSPSLKRKENLLLWRLLGLVYWVYLSGKPIARRTGKSPERLDLPTWVKGEKLRKRKWDSERESVEWSSQRRISLGSVWWGRGRGLSGSSCRAFWATKRERERIRKNFKFVYSILKAISHSCVTQRLQYFFSVRLVILFIAMLCWNRS